MGKGDIRIYDLGGRNVVPVRKFRVLDTGNQTAINAGELVKIEPTGINYVVPLADADPNCSADYVVGLAADDSDSTSSAGGTVDVYLDLPGIIYRAKVKTATDADTQTEIDDRLNYRVVIDLTSSKYTVDNTATDAKDNALILLGGNPDQSEVDFAIADGATWRNWAA